MIATIRRYDAPPTSLLDLIDRGIGDFNSTAAPLHDVQPLACFAEDSNGLVFGGVVGRTWGECAEVQQLWVHESSRRNGTGRALMQAFEEQARQRGCRRLYLDTWSFQAREFYESLGFEVQLTLAGFGPGLEKYTMVRTWVQ